MSVYEVLGLMALGNIAGGLAGLLLCEIVSRVWVRATQAKREVQHDRRNEPA